MQATAQQRTLFAFVRARPDVVVRRLPIHCGPRNTLNLASYVVNDGQLFGAGGKWIRNRFVGSHFKVVSVDESVLKSRRADSYAARPVSFR
jgi:hypothetical protein